MINLLFITTVPDDTCMYSNVIELKINAARSNCSSMTNSLKIFLEVKNDNCNVNTSENEVINALSYIEDTIVNKACVLNNLLLCSCSR